MGASGIGMSELLVILVIVVLLFGTKRLGSIGSDLGSAIRGFRTSLRGSEDEASAAERQPSEPRAGKAPSGLE